MADSSDAKIAGGVSSSWTAVLLISFGTFVMVTSEFLPIGLLGTVAADLHVPVGEAGLLLTAPGLMAAVAAPVLSIRAGTLDRRTLLVALSILLLLSDLVVAIAPNLAIALFGRMILGAALGGFWAFAAPAGQRLVRGSDGSRAAALILGGISVGTVFGVPIGTLIGGMFGWRTAFDCVAVLAAVILAGQALVLPSLPGAEPGSVRELLHILTIPQVRLGFAAAALIAGGHFAAYAYLEPFLATIRLPLGGITWILAGYGIAGVVGTWIGARFASWNVHVAFATVGALIAVAIAIAYFTSAHAIVAAAAVMIWGGAFGALPVCVQLWNYEIAPDRFESGSALTVTVFQFAVAGGAWIGGMAVDHVGIWAAYVTGAACAAAAALLLTASLVKMRLTSGAFRKTSPS